MELDIHTGTVMNMEPGSDFKNGTPQDEALRQGSETAVGTSDIVCEGAIFHSLCI